jgi:PAS domain S-box-containing protein
MKKETPKPQRKTLVRGSGLHPEGSSEDVTSLKQELRVHQEELRAQNEELRQAQRELSNALDRYKELFDSAPIGYLVLDDSFMIREANLEAAALCGVLRKDLIGSPLSKFMDGAEADTYHLHLMEARKKGTQQSCELAFRRPDGSLIHGHLETSPYQDSLFGKGWRIALVEITKRKLAEAALREANESLEHRVRERTMDLRKLASELVIAEERERKRIAVALHDDVAQTLAAVRMRLDMLQDIPPDQKDKIIKEAKALLVQSIQETRALMNDLSNPLLFDLGLKAACEALAERLMDRHPVRINCKIRDAYKHLNPDVVTIMYNMVRELLNNVVKHSQAQNAHVVVDVEGGHFHMEVTDDGLGFDPQKLGAPSIEGGFGLYSIRERLLAIGGNFKIESTPGTGTVVTANFPTAHRG